MKTRSLLYRILLTAVFAVPASTGAFATVYTINNVIEGSQEVPPAVTGGSGTVTGTYDDISRQLSVTITFSGLTGTTTAGHYHGPAAPGANAAVVIGFTNIPLGVTSGSFSPSHTLTAAQEAQLLAGQWYVNIHTSFRPGGEIRGQMYPQAPKQLQLSYIIEGLYNSGLNIMVHDTVTVNLRNSSSPYAIAESRKMYLNAGGSSSALYTTVPNGVPYYIQVLHRNGLETWSASPQSFTSNLLDYDFTTAASQAYGSNTTLLGSRYCAYSGDTDGDGTIDASDLSAIDNDATAFVSGYVRTDLDGNDFVDGSDSSVADNNAFSFVSVQRP